MEGTQWTQRTSQDRNSRCDVEKAFTSSLDISQKPDKKKQNKKHFWIHLVHFYCSSKGTQH